MASRSPDRAQVEDQARELGVAAQLGHVTLDEVIAPYEQLTRLDPGATWDWIALGRLYDRDGTRALS